MSIGMEMARLSWRDCPENSPLEETMRGLQWLGAGILVISLSIGCAPRATYLSNGSTLMSPEWTDQGQVFPEGSCNRCGVVAGCRCRIFPGRERVLSWLTCGGGCEDLYWGEWISDPPEVCDHCNSQHDLSVRVSSMRDFSGSRLEPSMAAGLDSNEPFGVADSLTSTPQPLWKTDGWSGRR